MLGALTDLNTWGEIAAACTVMSIIGGVALVFLDRFYARRSTIEHHIEEAQGWRNDLLERLIALEEYQQGAIRAREELVVAIKELREATRENTQALVNQSRILAVLEDRYDRSRV
jgi:hypothetical protein